MSSQPVRFHCSQREASVRSKAPSKASGEEVVQASGPIGDNVYGAFVARRDVKVEVAEGDVRWESGSRLFAGACCCSLKKAGSAG